MAFFGKRSAKVYWISGLTSSGKTTWANYLYRSLSAQGEVICHLDGDQFRLGVSKGLGYSCADREENIRRACEMTSLLLKQNISVVASFTTPTTNCRNLVTNAINAAQLVEIYCQCSINMCEVRDPKGFYHRARVSNLKDVVGWDLPFVPPKKPALVLDTEHQSIAHNQNQIRQLISKSSVKESGLGRFVHWS
jgi:adenylylsulfate kinase